MSRHKSFTLILSGGGGRGLAHVGVLRALAHYGYQPDAVVGISMGAIVGVTKSLNPDWYSALLNMDTSAFPAPPRTSSNDLRARIRAVLASERALVEMFLGWGVGERSLEAGQRLLRDLTLERRLEHGDIPVAVIAVDLYSGERVVLREGVAAEALYASAALPGILPPLRRDNQMLADGSYVDNAPVDIAREYGTDLVIAVDAGQEKTAYQINNGFQAMLRAMEICHRHHAMIRFKQADFVIRPHYPFHIDTLDFGHKRICVAAGIRAIRKSIGHLHGLLRPGWPAQSQDAQTS